MWLKMSGPPLLRFGSPMITVTVPRPRMTVKDICGHLPKPSTVSVSWTLTQPWPGPQHRVLGNQGPYSLTEQTGLTPRKSHMADRRPSLNTWQGGGVSGLCVRFGEGRGSYQMIGPPAEQLALAEGRPQRSVPTMASSFPYSLLCGCCLYLVSVAGVQVNTKTPSLWRWEVVVLAKPSP